jgi:hypothetical protein
MKKSPREILTEFDNLKDYNFSTVKEFVLKNFDEPGSELIEHEPNDWKEHPTFIQEIESIEFKLLSTKIHSIWRELVRKFDHEKYCSDCYSSIDIHHPFVM